jgi:glycosyltransferase involved in cell wall biosynthesis
MASRGWRYLNSSVTNRGVYPSMSQSVGVVVPCKDEIATIKLCLESLRAQTQPVTIVVMDNGSTDGSREVAEQLADRVVDLPGVPISTLRNSGAQLLADSDVLAFVDADCELAPGWLEAGLAGLESADMVGSRTLAATDAGWVASRWAAIEQQRAHAQSLLWSQHLLVRREAFEALQGFDETMRTGEDADLSARLRARGGRLGLRDDMLVTHHGFPDDLSRFVRRELWHTTTSGWYRRMAPKSRALVRLTAAWLGLGALAGAVVVARKDGAPLLLWSALTVAAVPLVGWRAGGSVRHSVQDGALLSIWSLIRVGRLGRQLVAPTGRVS